VGGGWRRDLFAMLCVCELVLRFGESDGAYIMVGLVEMPIGFMITRLSWSLWRILRGRSCLRR
jgi:hypothetical protein